MSKEAMTLALEALENSVDLVREDAYQAEKLYGNYPTRQGKVAGLKVLADDHEKAISALREALEQPAQKCSYPYCGCNSKAWCKVERNEALDKKAENARELGLDYEPAQQEPVAWKWQQAPIRTAWGDEMVVASIAIDKDHTLSLYCERDQSPKVEAMFAQRTWVGLTDDRSHQILLDMAKHIETFGDESTTEQALSAECIRFILERVTAHGIKKKA